MRKSALHIKVAPDLPSKSVVQLQAFSRNLIPQLPADLFAR